jgi:hypothetical protein
MGYNFHDQNKHVLGPPDAASWVELRERKETPMNRIQSPASHLIMLVEEFIQRWTVATSLAPKGKESM